MQLKFIRHSIWTMIIFQIVLISCEFKNPFNNELLRKFEYDYDGGMVPLKYPGGEEELINTSKMDDHIIIDVYKLVAAGDYNGNCRINGDTLILSYWQEEDEKYKNIDAQISLEIPAQFKYDIRNVEYKYIQLERLPRRYIKK